MTFSVINLGCKVNKYESDAILADFESAGFNMSEKPFSADIVVVNTCTVTNIADRKSRQMMRRAKRNGAIVVCTGCFADLNSEILKKYDYIDIIVPNNMKVSLVDIVISYLKGEDIQDIIKDSNNLSSLAYGEFKNSSYSDKTRAVLKVQDGCNMFCTYCIIPYARGRIVSRGRENILKEAKEIAKNGISEIVLTGIHVASYGLDNVSNIGNEDKENNGYFLIDLLEDLNNIEGIKRIRLSSIEPRIITEEFLKRLSKLDKVCHHFHLSLQSGSDYILKKMNRKYTIDEYIKKIQMLRDCFEDVMITTDIITGFPYETKERFKESYDNVDKIGFLRTHVFPYSEREGTVAAKFKNKVYMKTRRDRANIMIELSSKNNKRMLEKVRDNNNFGKGFDVLIEEEKDGKYYGYSMNYIRCMIDKKDLEERKGDTRNDDNENIVRANDRKEGKGNSYTITNISENIRKRDASSDENIGMIVHVMPAEVIEVPGNITEYVMRCN